MRGLEAHQLPRFHEPPLKVQDAFARAQARLQFLRVEGLCGVVVRAGL
jgi:hypothetical protein